VRRPASFLPQREGRNQTDKTRTRAANIGMERTDESTTNDHVVRTGAAGRMPVLDERKSSQRPQHRSRMSRMFAFWRKKHVKFCPHVVVHFESKWSKNDYRNARRGPCIHLAADRHRFQRRITYFDDNFGYIFTDIHREHVYDLIQEFNMQALIVDLNALHL